MALATSGYGTLAKASGLTKGHIITVADGVVTPPADIEVYNGEKTAKVARASYFNTFTSLGTEPAVFTANTVIPTLTGNVTALSIPEGVTVAIPFCTAIELSAGAGIAYA